MYDILIKNIKLNKCDNVKTFNFGGSDKDDIFYMYVDYDSKNNHGAFRICDEKHIQKKNTLKIECKQIDSLNLENIGYIKIDVEGHEYPCLKGMLNTIKTNKPVIEIEIHNTSPTRSDVLKLLYELNYTEYFKISHCDILFIR